MSGPVRDGAGIQVFDGEVTFESLKDLDLKMANEPVEAIDAKKEEEMVYNGVFVHADPRLWPKLFPKQSFNAIPEVFVDDWSDIRIALNTDNSKEAPVLRFPKLLDTEFYAEHLHIFQVPRLSREIPFEEVQELEIYNYTIRFEKKVIRFKVYTSGGRAELIFNQNDQSITAVIKYRDCAEWKVQLEPHKLYMITHRRPDWARED